MRVYVMIVALGRDSIIFNSCYDYDTTYLVPEEKNMIQLNV